MTFDSRRSILAQTASQLAQVFAPKPPGKLRFVSDAQPGIERRRAKDGSFTYIDVDGRSLREPEALARIRSLAIPPAWTDVWICPISNGHLQATGRDAKGR